MINDVIKITNQHEKFEFTFFATRRNINYSRPFQMRVKAKH